MADVPDGGGANNSGFWMGLGAVIAAAAGALGTLWEKMAAAKRTAREQQAKLDAEASVRKQDEETATFNRRQGEEAATIAQWKDLVQRQDGDISRLSAALDSKETHVNAIQSALNSLYRQCNTQEVDITEQYAHIMFYHGLAKRLALLLREKQIGCEEVPDPPTRPARRGDQEGADYIMNVAKQNTILAQASQTKLAVGGRGEK